MQACYKYGGDDDSVAALAQDHRNDVLSNSMALVTAYAAHARPTMWWLDPAGAILISLYIAVCPVGLQIVAPARLLNRMRIFFAKKMRKNI